MAYVDQAKAVLENLSGTTLTNQRAKEFATLWIGQDPVTTTLTNEEIAEAFVGNLLIKVKDRIRRQRILIELAANEDAVNAAGDNEVSDL